MHKIATVTIKILAKICPNVHSVVDYGANAETDSCALEEFFAKYNEETVGVDCSEELGEKSASNDNPIKNTEWFINGAKIVF